MVNPVKTLTTGNIIKVLILYGQECISSTCTSSSELANIGSVEAAKTQAMAIMMMA